MNGESKRTSATKFYNRYQRLTAVLQMLVSVCGKINLQRKFELVFLCGKKKCLRTFLQPFRSPLQPFTNLSQPFTYPGETPTSLRSQALTAQWDTPLKSFSFEYEINIKFSWSHNDVCISLRNVLCRVYAVLNLWRQYQISEEDLQTDLYFNIFLLVTFICHYSVCSHKGADSV